MNKWYRLGQEFAKKFDDKNVYDYLKKNNLCTVKIIDRTAHFLDRKSGTRNIG